MFAPGAVRTTAALVAPSGADDGRYIFIVPWEDRVYAGTTDTPYSGDLDHPAVDAADRDYLLSAVARNFPGVTERDVVASWAGLRPLLSQDEELGDARTSDLSRNHAIFTDPPGLFTITGGKLTTYRAMAEDLVDRVAAALGDAGPGGDRAVPDPEHPARAARVAGRRPCGWPGPRWPGWACRRGRAPGWCSATATTGGRPLRMIGEDRSLGEPVVGTLPVLGVEVALARSREMALTDEDVFVRRTRLTTRDASLRLTLSGGHMRE